MKTRLILIGCTLACALAVVLAARGPAALAEEPAPVEQCVEHPIALTLAQPLPDETLDAEVLRALRYWNPRVLEGTLRPWARAITDAAGSREDAIWLASQASVETKFVPEVLDFRCNRGGWRECDHGAAVGPWQMHDRRMLGAAPAVQAARAIAWMRAHPQAWTTWRAARVQTDQWLEGAK